MAVRHRFSAGVRASIATAPAFPSAMTILFILAPTRRRPLRSLPNPVRLPIALLLHPATLTWASCQCRAHHTSQFPAPSPVQDCRALSWQVVAFSAGGDGGAKSPELVHQPAPQRP